MSQQVGLSFEQAPPFVLPLRFFLTAPLFLLAAAILIVLAPGSLASRWTPQALALTHALTLGFLAMVMLGALMQMLPVVAGATMLFSRAVGWLTHALLALGSAALMAGFLTGDALLYQVGMALLASAFLVFLLAASSSLVRAVASDTVSGMRLAMLCLAITAALGLALALSRSTGWVLAETAAAIAAHAVLGLLGWVLLLVVSVAYQVVPMFQITPPYPPLLARWFVPVLFTLLVIVALAPLLPREAASAVALIAQVGLATGILAFALLTLRLQSQRRRKLPDVSLDFWRLGMASLIASVVAWMLARLSPGWADSDAYPLLLGVLFIGGFAVSVVSGMLYKIVPFLAWFHLQAQLQARAGSIPNMKEMTAQRWMRWHFRLHLLACALLGCATISPGLFAMPGGIATGLSAMLLWLNLVTTTRRYVSHGGRFA
ncbi:MAG: hypothetical protein MUE59_07580 [Thiobacillaceae bacterium]|jgi:hypothetical protein|nr:hypothetical protein [Thiobacillaceae bacterium]